MRGRRPFWTHDIRKSSAPYPHRPEFYCLPIGPQAHSGLYTLGKAVIFGDNFFLLWNGWLCGDTVCEINAFKSSSDKQTSIIEGHMGKSPREYRIGPVE